MWRTRSRPCPAFALCAGPALYYLAHVAFRWRNRHTLAHRRIVVAALLLAFFPVATETSALVALAGVAAAEAGLLLYESSGSATRGPGCTRRSRPRRRCRP